jgi:hypothetical protein
MQHLKDFDAKYRQSLFLTVEELENAYRQMAGNYKFDLNSSDVTEAILERLKSYSKIQEQTKILLDKRYKMALADYFVETVTFFLKLFLKSQNSELEVHSERQIRRKKNSIRPDISIWNDDEVVAIIECKTQLGWNRKDWRDKFLVIDDKLRYEFPNAKSFLLTMTQKNWGGFDGDVFLNQKFFSLLNDTWIDHYSDPFQIYTPIENLFKKLI